MRSAGLGAAFPAVATGSVRGFTPGTGTPWSAPAAGFSVGTGGIARSALAAACSDCAALPAAAPTAARGGKCQTVTIKGGGNPVVAVSTGHRRSAPAYAASASGAHDYP